MNDKPALPSMLKIGLQDTISVIIVFLILGLPFGLVGLFLETSARNRNSEFWSVVAIVVIAILISVALLVWRLRHKQAKIHGLWARGIVDTATIISVQDVGGGRYRQRVLRYSYVYEDKTYTKGTQVGRKWTPPSETLPIMIDPQNPDKSLLIFQYS